MREQHVWTTAQLNRAAERWRAGCTQEQVADDLAERFGVIVTRHAIAGLARRYRDLFPARENPRGGRRRKP